MKKEYILNNVSAVLAIIIKHAKQQQTRHSYHNEIYFSFSRCWGGIALFYN